MRYPALLKRNKRAMYRQLRQLASFYGVAASQPGTETVIRSTYGAVTRCETRYRTIGVETVNRITQ